ncbi:LysE family transporter [Roseobacter sp.]|uniref:LysE family translocator n=1 Tax=Roseobacter sp. TaxID=1907202 RepID=UPI0032980AEC
MSVAVTSLVVFAASQIGTPGPAGMALMSAAARHGVRATLPFLGGVILSKQLVIWPMGFGLMQLANDAPWLFETLKYVSAAYIMWLAWRVAHIRLGAAAQVSDAPGFVAGLMVHPVNPKAWAMIIGGFTAFVGPGTPTLEATATIAAVMLGCQMVLHPLWTLAGEAIARTVAGRALEPYLMWTLATLTVASVLFVLFGGGI